MHRALARQTNRLRLLADNALINQHITWAEDEHTSMAKDNTSSTHRRAVNHNHSTGTTSTTAPSLHQKSCNASLALSTTLRQATRQLCIKCHVHFSPHSSICHFDPHSAVPMINSGADSHYLSETDHHAAGLPILQTPSKHVGVANGSTSKALHVSRLPFPHLSLDASQEDSFSDFPHSLMSVGKICDDGTISIFSQNRVTIHKEQDVLLTCKGEPILIGVCDNHGRYRIPLIQNKGHWQPHLPSKKARHTLQ